MTDVKLTEITEKTLRTALKLKVADDQTSFVAPNAFSISEAYFEKAAWFRAIEADGEFVGFVMVFDPTLADKEMTQKEREEMYLWRFMLDARYQRKGYGAKALNLVFEHARSRPGLLRMLSSFVDAPGGPEDFYIGHGFTKTGNILDGEVEIIMDL